MSSFQGWDTKLDRFWAKINIIKGNYFILWIDIVANRQKLDIILENKESPKLKLFYKFCIPSLKTRQPILPFWWCTSPCPRRLFDRRNHPERTLEASVWAPNQPANLSRSLERFALSSKCLKRKDVFLQCCIIMFL